ncbi:methyltransferase domain-containing protein [Nocardia sp. CDC153]|uniref:class I SAM-dependent methyltransferase n=1 Tax=Nocardia sp. CDC153 TaxID=3112167 RepID=UPI002DBEF507|nr:methyltransferase domain-containing protein [Nocardia sp. CDC153]MEC3957512.1 methyltransferase domain-containing protein [Nocardia sp. CDC153]
MRRKTVVSTVAAGLAAGSAYLWFGDSAPFPYSQRWMLDVPLPGLTTNRLTRVLRPTPGERMLEIGPGTGLQTLAVADRLGPAGRVDIVDIQQEMLDHVERRARHLGTVVPTRSDARELPFAAGTFDAAYMVTVLGEIGDPAAVLREMTRVLKPGGRLVIGEFFDPHWIPFGRLRDYAEAEHLHIETRIGPTTAYLARLRPCTHHRYATV